MGLATSFRRLLGVEEPLFGGDGKLFLEAVRCATSYGEYGCGQSTVWVARNTDLPIVAVDTSKDWAERVTRDAGRQINVQWINVGDLGTFGRPLTYAHRDQFKRYALAIWEKASPDLVLIDGRFRVACFFASMARCKAGTRIVFDDYTNRPRYHVVAEMLPPTETHGRQALFIVPPLVDRPACEAMVELFQYVIE